MDRRLQIIGVVALLGMMVLPAADAEGDDGPARKLINAQGCKACHALAGDGGTAAPSFEEMRAKLARPQIRSQLINQTQRHGNGSIPDFSHLAGEEIDALVNFIQPQP